MTFRVIVDPEAKADLLRLYEYLLERAEYVEDLDIADRALEAIDAAMSSLARTPFLFRKTAGSRSPLRRELVVPFGAAGYVLKYEIASPQLVVVLAIRHQHEADYH
ncbi:type II toxin-antitoxin system RelE/ParE family toxin [Roseateles saccharophilus]|uniref:ParE-like toxin of type II ParDE toxin-antitoxin system n=1 Tax=Roseateles saccharophilus TaxID=304 RepID=A0A4R3UIQ4_ROSSA|nr:type II toxin-antitoxin system RelE/ParE family toxin [Roseateles saccharophilus]MDG0834818.1 type II toxin-antitoxin system RelE/ParE family toxin [Roseateles saccharophilus]TCU88941.1 ParE-like toxin of type II ParDE toxin-antitoxin system [Roseateles saccharophilus]